MHVPLAYVSSLDLATPSHSMISLGRETIPHYSEALRLRPSHTMAGSWGRI